MIFLLVRGAVKASLAPTQSGLDVCLTLKSRSSSAAHGPRDGHSQTSMVASAAPAALGCSGGSHCRSEVLTRSRRPEACE